jgi:hypothetical protein
MNDENENVKIIETQGSNQNEENLVAVDDNQETLNLEKANPELEFDDQAEGIQPSKKKSIILSNLPTMRNDLINDISEEQIKRREELEKIQLRKTQANLFEKYLNDTGIASAFELIFSEMITKKIPSENHFTYTAGRLRQIGREIEIIKQKNK